MATEPATAELLRRSAEGDGCAADRLLPIVYEDLRELAGRYASRAADGMLLDPTAIVHEAYLKLAGAETLDVRSRTHFYALAARTMRQVIVDQVRHDRRGKRGGGWDRVTLTDARDELGGPTVDFARLHEALERLAELDERAARTVVLRFFGGLSEAAVAEILAVSDRTVRNDWRMARAWLRDQMAEDRTPT